MARLTAHVAIPTAHPPEWLPGLHEAAELLFVALVAATDHSDRAAVDLDAIGRRLGLKPLIWRIALVDLRRQRRIEIRHQAPPNFHLAEIYLPPGEQY